MVQRVQIDATFSMSCFAGFRVFDGDDSVMLCDRVVHGSKTGRNSWIRSARRIAKGVVGSSTNRRHISRRFLEQLHAVLSWHPKELGGIVGQATRVTGNLLSRRD